MYSVRTGLPCAFTSSMTVFNPPSTASLVIVWLFGANSGGLNFDLPRLSFQVPSHSSAARTTPGVAKPAAYLEPHSSADGLAFWRGDLFVAEWGQYLSKRFGRRVVRVDLRPNGTARSVAVFASGAL